MTVMEKRESKALKVQGQGRRNTSRSVRISALRVKWVALRKRGEQKIVKNNFKLMVNLFAVY